MKSRCIGGSWGCKGWCHTGLPHIGVGTLSLTNPICAAWMTVFHLQACTIKSSFSAFLLYYSFFYRKLTTNEFKRISNMKIFPHNVPTLWGNIFWVYKIQLCHQSILALPITLAASKVLDIPSNYNHNSPKLRTTQRKHAINKNCREQKLYYFSC